MSRRRGSATALKASEVVAARGMRSTLHSYMGICQAGLCRELAKFHAGRSPGQANTGDENQKLKTVTSRLFDSLHVLGREGNLGSLQVLFQVCDRRSSRNRQGYRAAMQKPCQRELRPRRSVPLRPLVQLAAGPRQPAATGNQGIKPS